MPPPPAPSLRLPRLPPRLRRPLHLVGRPWPAWIFCGDTARTRRGRAPLNPIRAAVPTSLGCEDLNITRIWQCGVIIFACLIDVYDLRLLSFSATTGCYPLHQTCAC